MAKSAANRNYAVDAARFIAACGVVFIHTASDSVTNAAAEVARFAVPFFFMLSGYFLKSEWKLTKRVLPVYVFWVVVYLLADAALHFWTIRLPIVWELALKGGAGGHLWFLSSLMQGAMLLALLRPFGWRVVLSVAAISYGVNLMIGTYGEILPTNPGWNSRWGPAVGLLFVASGRYYAERPIRVPFWTAAAASFIFLILDFAELQVIKMLGFNASFGVPDIRLMTLPYGISVFLMVMEASKVKLRTGDNIIEGLGYLGRVALGIYVVHVLIIKLLQETTFFAANPLPTALFTIVVSTVISIAACQARIGRIVFS